MCVVVATSCSNRLIVIIVFVFITGSRLQRLEYIHYTPNVATNTEIFLTHQLTEIMKSTMRKRHVHMNDYYMEFPLIFNDVFHHLTCDEPCLDSGCLLPSRRERDLSHWQYLVQQIKMFTVFECVHRGLDYTVGEDQLKQSNVEKCLWDMLKTKRSQEYKNILEACFSLGRYMVGL